MMNAEEKVSYALVPCGSKVGKSEGGAVLIEKFSPVCMQDFICVGGS